LQNFILVKKGDDEIIKSKLITVDPKNIEIEEINEFDYYYLESKIENSELIINGSDQIGSELVLKIKNTLANSR